MKILFLLDEQPYASLFEIYKKEFLDVSVSKGLINTKSLALASDGTSVVTSHKERKKRIYSCAEKGILDCKCDRYFSQLDCDIGWDSSRACYYHGYDLYMLVASDSESALPVFPHFSCASKHDSHGFLHAFFRFKSFLPDYKVSKLLLDSAHEAMPYYEYYRKADITPFIDLNGKEGVKLPFYHIMMLQHLDAWDLSFKSTLQKLILNAATVMSISHVFFCFLDNIYFSMFITSCARYNHSEFREIIKFKQLC